jgi:transposase
LVVTTRDFGIGSDEMTDRSTENKGRLLLSAPSRPRKKLSSLPNCGSGAKSNRLHPWEYDRALYKKRNEVERLFRRLKGFRRLFSRFEKLDVVFLAFLCFALIVEALRLCVNRP